MSGWFTQLPRYSTKKIFSMNKIPCSTAMRHVKVVIAAIIETFWVQKTDLKAKISEKPNSFARKHKKLHFVSLMCSRLRKNDQLRPSTKNYKH